MFCKDPSIKLLKKFGYNVVRLPKADIAPMQAFIVKKGEAMPLGPLSAIFKPLNGVPAPTLKMDVPAASINGEKTSDLSAGLGISILDGLISVLSGSKISLNAQFNSASAISFQFADVFEDSINVFELDKYLGSVDIDPASTFIPKLLEADDVYVIIAIIKTNKLSIDSKSSGGQAPKVDIPVIKEIVGANVEVSANQGNSSNITFEGKTQLTFGFKAVRIFFDNGKYERFQPAKHGVVPLTAPDVTVTEGSQLFNAGEGLLTFE